MSKKNRRQEASETHAGKVGMKRFLLLVFDFYNLFFCDGCMSMNKGFAVDQVKNC